MSVNPDKSWEMVSTIGHSSLPYFHFHPIVVIITVTNIITNHLIVFAANQVSCHFSLFLPVDRIFDLVCNDSSII